VFSLNASSVRLNASDVQLNASDVQLNASDVRLNASDVRANILCIYEITELLHIKKLKYAFVSCFFCNFAPKFQIAADDGDIQSIE